MTKRTLQRKSALDARSQADIKFFPAESQERSQGSDVKLTEIYVNSEQFRFMLDGKTVEELKTSISANGFQGAIIVRPLPEGKRSDAGQGKVYELVAGHHRFKAMQELQRETIPASIQELNDEQARRVQFEENALRKNYNVLEEHEALLQIIIDETGVSEEHLKSAVDAQSNSKKAKKELTHDVVGKLKAVEAILVRYRRQEQKKERTPKGFIETLRRLRSLPEDCKKYLKQIDYTKLFELKPIESVEVRQQFIDWILRENPTNKEIQNRKKELLPKMTNDGVLETDFETGMKDALKRYRKMEVSLTAGKKRKAEKLVAQLLKLLEAEG